MLRRLFTLLSALSLLLSLATVVIWTLSYWRLHSFQIEWYEIHPRTGDHALRKSIVVRATRGALWCFWMEDRGSELRVPGPVFSRWLFRSSILDHDSLYLPHSAENPANWRLGFAYGNISNSFDGLRAPLWSIAAVTCLPAIPLLSRHVRHRRRLAHSLCLTCAYDLRASTERCPECGSPIATSEIRNQESRIP